MQCLAVGVLAWSATTLTFSSLEDNEFAGTSTGGPTPELRAAYAGTSAVLKFLLATASLAIVTEVAAIVVQIAARCLELKEFQPLSLAFHIPVSQEKSYFLRESGIAVQDIVVGGLLALMYVAGGVASAYYASVWGGRPEGCESLHDLEIPDPCRSIILTADCSILTVSPLPQSINYILQSPLVLIGV